MKKKLRSAYLLESLEARLLFSADLAPLPVDGGTTGAEFESDLEISLQPDSAGVQEAKENNEDRQEVIFVDSGVDDYQQLIDDIESQLENGRQFDIVSLDSGDDGITQISDYLSQQENVAAVHIISHGADGEVFLGNSRLNSTTMNGYAEAIEGWQRSLSSDADLLFYGCNLAAGDGGQELVNSLTLLTGADVAASDDVTGSAKLGGDWDLEYSKGTIETAVAFSPEAQQNWNGVLATFTVNTTADTVDANPGDGIAEDAAGNTSLRAAIMEANALIGTDTINFDITGAGPHTIAINSSGLGELPQINTRMIIDGSSEPDYINAPVIEINGSLTSNADGLILAGSSDGSTIRGLSITGFTDMGFNGNAVIIESDNNSIVGNYIGVTPDGDTAVSNQTGIDIRNGAGNNIIGGTTTADRNVISGSDYAGVTLHGLNTDGNRVIGNFIGLNADGDTVLTSGTFGVVAWDQAADNMIGGINPGEGNRIAGHREGVVVDITAMNTSILGNEIFENREMGIDLNNDGITYNDANDSDGGPNDQLNYPVITDVQQVGPDLDVTFSLDLPAGDYRIEFFENPLGMDDTGYGEGKIFLGAVDVTSSGIGSETFTEILVGVTATNTATVVATATEKLGGSVFGSTSEFGPAIATDATYLDQFASDSVYNGSDGSINWSGNPWQESEGDGPSSGKVAVVDRLGTFYGISIEDDGPSTSVWREADLSTAITATLSFDYALLNVESEYIVLEISDNGGGSWTELDRFVGDDPFPDTLLSVSYDITQYMANNTQIRFREINFNGNDEFHVDNVQIAYNVGNVAPTASGTYNMASTDEDTTSTAVQVSAILSDASIMASDLDGDTLGIAVFAQTGLGTWQYSTDGVAGWTDFGTVNPNAALLLSETTWVRYVPDGANGESVGFDFRAWDQSTDLASTNRTPRVGDTIPGGGTTAYSSGNASVALAVSSANDAPIASNLTSTSSYNEGDASVAITDIVVTDVDSSEMITATLTLNDISTGSLSANNGATYDGGTGIWTITDTVANVNLALANLIFKPLVDNDVDTTISVSIDDGDEDGSGPLTGTITLDVTPVNDPPTVVTNAPLNVPEEATRTITSAYLETTDPDNSPDQIIYTLTSLPSGGSVRLNGTALTSGQTFTQDDINNNRVTYRDSDDGETTSFTMAVSDGNTTLPAFSFSINGQPINDAPVVSAPGSALNAIEQIGLAIHGTGFSVSDLDEAGAGAIATLTVGEGTISVIVGNSGVSIDSGDGTGTVALSGSIAQLNALLTGTSTGTMTYLNNSDNPSSSTTLTITVNDQGNTGTDPGLTGDGSSEEGSNSVTINIAPVNDVPVATGNTVIASEDVPLVIGPGDFNFTDVEGDSLVSVTITGLNLNGGTLTHSAGAVTVTNGMTITAAELADLTFTSAPNDSTDCSFTYTVNDAGAGVTSAVMNITVNAVNDVPVATGNTVIASEDVPLVIGPGDFNFTDTEGDSLVSVTITGLNLNGGTLTHSAGAVTVTNGMTITVAQLADLTFTSALNDSTNCSFTYRVNDAGTGVTSAVMNITVNAVNDVPVATGNTVITTEDVPLMIGPGDFNFTDVEGDSLVSVTITGLNLNGGTLTHSAGAVTVTNGMTITAAELVDLTFTSALNDSTNCSFTYRVNDAGTGVTSAVMNITVNAVNDVPVATGNTVIASEDVPLVIGPGDFNFTDVEGDSLASVTITGLNLNGGTLTHSAGAVNVTNGMTITAAELADLTFTSALNDSTDCSFTYTVNDAGSGVTSAVMNITVNAVNDAGTVTINNNTPAQGDTLTANVVDPDGASGAISFQWFSDGAVIGGANGKTYATTQSDVGAVMTVTAIYTDDQGTAESLASAPTAPVTNVNDTPIAVNDNLNATEDQSMTFTSVTDLLGNDSDIALIKQIERTFA